MKYYKNNDLNDILVKIAFAIYIVLLTWIIMFKFGDRDLLSYPFNVWINHQSYYDRFMHQFKEGFNNQISPMAIKGYILNILITIPFGIYLPLLFNKKYNFLRDLLIILGVISIYEFSQFAFRLGCIDYMDYILNTSGFILGSLIYKFIIHKHLQNYIINLINKIIIIVGIPVIIYAITITSINFDCILAFWQ